MPRQPIDLCPAFAVASLTLAVALAGGPPAAAAGLDRLTVHGHLTQAYATSSDAQVLGIPTDGTTDYRTMALQFRYDIGDRDAVVVQLSHESIGLSPFGGLRDDVELDWAFYKHTFANDSHVRVGRMPIPFGIYNEVRDVGTVLEFYRPPVGTYFEGSFANESVDGVVFGHRFFAETAWSLSADLYYGSWRSPEPNVASAGEIEESQAEDAVGVQLWLETPWEGLRLGAAVQTVDLTGGDLRRNGKYDNDTVLLSLDLDRERFYVRAEAQRIQGSADILEQVDLDGWYAQAGLRLGSWGLNLLYETSAWTLESELLSATLDLDPFYDAFAAGENA